MFRQSSWNSGSNPVRSSKWHGCEGFFSARSSAMRQFAGTPINGYSNIHSNIYSNIYSNVYSNIFQYIPIYSNISIYNIFQYVSHSFHYVPMVQLVEQQDPYSNLVVQFMGDIGRMNEQVIRVRTHFGSSNVDAWCVLASHCAKHPPTDLFNATSNMFKTKMLREEVTPWSRPKSNIAKTESMKTTGMRTMGTSGKKNINDETKHPNLFQIHATSMVQWSTSGSSPDLSKVAVLSTAKRFEDQSTLGLSLLELKCCN